METQLTAPGAETTSAITPAVEQQPLQIFMTGGTTALGREVTRQLVAAGHRVMGAVVNHEEAARVRADGGLPAYPGLYRAGEIRSAMQGMGAQVALNLAPTAANQAPQHAAAWDMQLSEAARAFAEAAKAANLQYILHASYAFAEARDPQATPLLRAMRGAERAILSAGVPAAVLRFGYLYGADSDALKAMRGTMLAGRPMLTGSDAAQAAWVYLPDAARAVLLALQTRPAGVTLDIVDDHLASPAAFVRYFAESLQVNVPGRVPGFLSRALLPKTQTALMNLSSHADNDTAKTTLGWQPRFPDYRRGLDDTLLQWRATEAVTN